MNWSSLDPGILGPALVAGLLVLVTHVALGARVLDKGIVFIDLAIVRAAYQDPKPSEWLSDRTGVPAVALPFSVGGDAQSKDLFGLFDSTIAKLLGAAK